MKNTVIQFLLIISVAFPLSVISQEYGKPFITNFTSKEFKGHNQNWVIEQDTNGIVYIGNQAGVLIYDGLNWQQVAVSNHSTVRSLSLGHENRIYVGAVGEFGFLHPDNTGVLIYKSLISLVDSTSRNFGDVWNCQTIGDKVYFLTDRFLFEYSGDTIKVFNSKGDYFYSCFAVDSTLYIHDFGYGFCHLKNDTIQPLPNGKNLASASIHAVLPFETDQILLGIRSYGMVIMNVKTGSLSILYQKLTGCLNDWDLYQGIVLDSNHYALGTLRNGIVIIDKLGNIKEVINKRSGLQSESVYYLKNDRGVLWCALENGISIIDWETPIRYWDESVGLKGSITDILRFNHKFYATTGMGLYWLNQKPELPETQEFVAVSNINEQAWSLCHFKTKNNQPILLVGTSKGLYFLEDSLATRVYRGNSVYKILASQKYPDIIFLGINNQLAVITYNEKNRSFSEPHFIADFDQEIRNLYEDSEGMLWAEILYTGVAKIAPVAEGNQITCRVILYGPEKGLNIQREVNFFDYRGVSLFSTENGVYRYNKESDLFLPDSFFMNQFKTEKNKPTLFTIDQAGNGYINGRYLYHKNNSDWLEDSILLKILPEFSIEVQYCDSSNNCWIGSSEGIYKISIPHQTQKKYPFKTLIRKVVTKNDSVLFRGNYYEKQIPRLNHFNNFIRFDYSATYYEKPSDILYSYLLEGYDESWSDWSKEQKKEFTNLFEGTYTFRVKSKNLVGTESLIYSYTFTILPPIYRTVWAYIFYLLLIVAFTLLVVQIRTRKLRSDKIKLESIIQQRTEEIIYQKNQIEQAAKKLQIVNRELEKLSVIAQKTDNAVGVFDKNGNIEWVNHGFTHLYGYTLDQFINEKGQNIISSSANPNIKTAVEACLRTKETTIYQFFTLTRQSEGIWAQTTLTPILDESGAISKLIAIDSNITKLKDAEQQIENQRDELDEANKTKDKFFSIIAHDLRGPLSNIFTLLTIIYNDLDQYPAAQLKELIGQLRESTGKTFNLTENLLDWAHLQKNTIPYHPRMIQIYDLVQENIELFQSQSDKKQISLENKIDPTSVAFADEEMIKTVIRNLIGNAIKFTEKSGKITLHQLIEKDKIWINVSDTGTGMDPQEIEKIFRIDLHHTTLGTNQERGSGLGLILIKEFVEKNLGAVQVESIKGKGSTFSFSLPLHDSSKTE